MKHRKCDSCERPATNHCVQIVKGQKIEKHLCDVHAAAQGIASKAFQPPLTDLLTKFVQTQSGPKSQDDPSCTHCGMAFSQFRQYSLMGCPACYESFEPMLVPLLERAHEGGDHHLGKVPRRAGSGQQRQQQMLRMRKRLAQAIAAEDYELASRLRDDIRRHEEQPS